MPGTTAIQLNACEGSARLAGKKERLPRVEIAGCLRLFVVVVVMK